MKKRFSSLLLALLLTLCLLPAIASADGELPFTLVPPGNLTVAWLETNDSPTTVNVSPLVSICVLKRFSVSVMTGLRSVGTGMISIFPLSMRLISRTSLISASRCPPESSIFDK